MIRTVNKTPRIGFTLIEVLTVLGIIVLLAAILFPVFARVRESARRASCQSNVKQILLGVMQYTQDYDEKYPPTILCDPPAAPTYIVAWYQLIQSYIKSTQVFQCPSDPSTTLSGGVTNLPNGLTRYHTSYAANIYAGSIGASANGYVDKVLSQAGVQQPSTTVYIADGGAQTFSTAAGSGVLLDSNGDPTYIKPGCSWMVPPSDGAARSTNGSWCGPNPRHLGTAVVGFFDGHVKSLNTQLWYYTGSPWLDPAVGGS